MRKLAVLLIILLTFSCSESGSIEIDLSKGKNTIFLVPKNATTSRCELRVKGVTDYPFMIKIESENSLKFKLGKIKFSQNYEWYEKGKKIEIYSDSCISQNTIKIEYQFSSGYFGSK